MIGAIVGVLVTAGICFAGDLSWWWLLAGGFTGLLGEVSVRCGCGEEFGEALGALGDALSNIDFSSSNSGGGDCGGGGDS